MTTVDYKRTRITRRFKMNYTVEKLENALKSVKEGKLKICEAAKIYKIPRQTLADKLRGRRPQGFCRPGPSAVLGTEIELKIENWLLDNAKHGFLLDREGLNYSIQHILNSIPSKIRKSVPFKNGTPGKGWFKSYRERHPKIAAIYAEVMKQSKLEPTEEEIGRWFNEIRQLMAEKSDRDCFRNPERIFAANEILVRVNPDGSLSLGDKKRSWNNSHYSIFLTVNALGKFAPPVLTLPSEDFDSKNNDWGIFISETCSLTCESFFKYIKDIFHPYLLTYDISFPVVVFLNGEFPYISLPLTTFCEENNIILIGMPKNSANILQPLHPVINQFPLGMTSYNFKYNYKNEHPVQIFLGKLLSSGTIKQYLSDKFAKCGLFPFSVFKVEPNITKIEPLKPQEENDIDLHVIQYIESKISNDLLEQFRRCRNTSQSWTGYIQYEALYDFWLNALDNVRNEISKENSKSNSLGEFKEDDLEHYIIVEEIDMNS